MFVVVVLFLPKGIVGLPAQLFALIKRGGAFVKKTSGQGVIAAELPMKESSTAQSPGAPSSLK
jgi:hypothetical protein